MKRALLVVLPVALVACRSDVATPDSSITGPVRATASSAGTQPKLSFFKGGGASIGWSSSGGSSPADQSNNVSLQIQTGPKNGSAAGAYTWGNDEAANTIVGRRLGQITHLGFDSRGYLSAGSPRISLTTIGNDGNHTYFLSAYHCNPGAPQGIWVTSNFLSSSCAIFRDGEVSSYAGLGGAAVVADANGETVTDWFLIQDEGPAIVYVDRLSVQDWMWIRSGTAGIRSCLDVNPPCI
jgi:hypothetical protein